MKKLIDKIASVFEISFVASPLYYNPSNPESVRALKEVYERRSK